MIKNNYFLDANILIRHFTQDDLVLSTKATTFIERIAQKEIFAYITTLVLHETIYILVYRYKVDRKTLVRTLKNLLQLNNLQILDMERSLVYKALEDFGNNSIDFPDCIYKQIAIENNLQLVSFDKDFKKLKIQAVN